ncbi:ketosteroid isomerase [Rhodococcus sp. Leaf7]|uniref:nuclear transport factor 2 family protein n=1 Tax=unclassified Rhodococcus (in: high G+C Gram-positive bacteria) TaxID=192944 RepID=UPI0006F5929A|nr:MULTISPECIES: nuclear transport factor 2 family protein [unclassified Rhodococcus (in: high G+C Gram-positive bacteria)]KQU03175.1 ketosteroid isomerase [Rhodococcus sp. Leaf7]KQU38275.1 ketosteroid isomerase [Rhodococcus sp. Leaf247]
MTESTALDVATRYFDALSTGDMSTLMGLIDDDVVWHQPGANQFSGEHRGVGGVGALLSAMMTTSQGTFGLTVEGPMMVNGTNVAVPVRFTGRLQHASMDMSGLDLLTVVNGKIVDVHLFSSDGDAEDEFWGTN